MGKRDLYTGPFPKPSQLANQMGMGIREALRTFTVPEQIVYKPCMSIINPSSDFEPETQIRRSAQTPTSRLQLGHVFGHYEMTDEEFQAYAVIWREQGAQIIGGCCGIGPQHIRALATL